MSDYQSKHSQVADAALAKIGARPADRAKQDLDFATAERFIKSARLRELRLSIKPKKSK